MELSERSVPDLRSKETLETRLWSAVARNPDFSEKNCCQSDLILIPAGRLTCDLANSKAKTAQVSVAASGLIGFGNPGNRLCRYRKRIEPERVRDPCAFQTRRFKFNATVMRALDSTESI